VLIVAQEGTKNLNRKQKRAQGQRSGLTKRQWQAQARHDRLPTPATITVPRDDILTVERMITETRVTDDDPEYLLTRLLMIGLNPPSELAARAKQEAMACRDGTRLGVYRMIARKEAIRRKILAELQSKGMAS
jgi:hypothetical protein